MNSDNLTNVETKWEGKWIRAVSRKYQVGEKEINWECIERTTRTSAGIDGVNVIATFNDPQTNEGKIILIANYRPPVEKYCIEFPAGLVDPGQDVKTTALRELKEECGYLATEEHVEYVTGSNCLAAPLINELGCIVKVKLDMSLPENQNPQQELEPEENIEVIVFNQANLLQQLEELDPSKYVVDSRIHTFALGAQFANAQ